MQTDVTQALASGTQSYRQRQAYDAYYGRPIGQEYPNGEAVEFLYTAYGHAVRERDPVTGLEYRVTTATDARGSVTGEQFAHGNITETRQYLAQTGQLALVQYSNFGGASLRKLEYRYDVYGNLASQSLNSGSSLESYRYDALHRLTEATRTGAATGITTYGYDAVGNFTYKSDFSTTADNAYSYTGGGCGGGPNAVKAVQTSSGTRSYCFDANGNLTADSVGLSVKYDHQNLPVVAQRGALRDDFRYGPDGQRTRSWGSDGARVYLSGYEHRTDTGETKVYVGDYAVITRSGSTRKVEYLLKDRLGSVAAVADGSGVVTETRGYDAFGKPRSGTWADLSPAKLQSTATTPKGFTQHEHLNQLELIHMNGRMFDYNLGRFTGVDPFIQFPLNSQSLNPYSYLMNNPLSGTDPTGYMQDCADATQVGSCGYTETGSRIHKTAEIGVGKSGNPEFVGAGSVGGKLITSTGSISAQWASGSGGKSTSGMQGAENRQQQKAGGSDKLTGNTTGSYANGAVSGDVSATLTPKRLDLSVTGSGAEPKDFEVPSSPVLADEASNLQAIAFYGFLTGPNASRESAMMMTDEGSILPKSCSEFKCSWGGETTATLRFAMHVHVFSGSSSSIERGMTNAGRMTFGPGDHAPLVALGIPNYLRDLNGDISVLEYNKGYVVTYLTGPLHGFKYWWSPNYEKELSNKWKKENK